LKKNTANHDPDETVGLIRSTKPSLESTQPTTDPTTTRKLNPTALVRRKHYKLADLNSDQPRRDLQPGPYEDFPKTEVVAGRNDDESDKSILEHGERRAQGNRRERLAMVSYG